MTYYEHRRLVTPSMICIAGALIIPGVLAYRDALGQWWEAWPLHLLFGTVIVLWYVTIARYSNRHVRVDDDGLWVDGELVAAPEEIVALGSTHDPVIFGGMRLVGTSSLPRPRGDATGRRSLWGQSSWARVVEVPGVEESAVITRERDLVKGSWLERNVVVVTDRWYARGFREAWLISSYRPARLTEALSRVAPTAHRQLADDSTASPRPGPGAAGVPGAAAELDER